jgi:hypothetical protein
VLGERKWYIRGWKYSNREKGERGIRLATEFGSRDMEMRYDKLSGCSKEVINLLAKV